MLHTIFTIQCNIFCILDILGLAEDLKHKTFLEELVFWTVKMEFPQKLVCFLLNMLPDKQYKVSITTLVCTYLLSGP